MGEAKYRYTIKWVSQNEVEVTDEVKDDFFFIRGSPAIIERYEGLPPELANLYFEGYMAGVDWCDGQLKHCLHNFVAMGN